MTHSLKSVGILLAAGLMLAACSSSGSSSNNSDSAKIASADSKRIAKANTKKADKKVKVEVEVPKSVKTGLSQRPSEINVSVRGKVTRTGEIYLLRGLANVFSRGMDTMGAKMVRKGLDARVYNHAAWRELADNIIARNKKKDVSYPIVIMGHSLGANASMLMANYLGERGVKVSYVVGFDPTISTTVGRNIKRVINFYLPLEDNSNAVKPGRGFGGVLKNINSRGVRNIKHTSIEKDSKYQSEVINRTLSLTKKRRKKRK